MSWDEFVAGLHEDLNPPGDADRVLPNDYSICLGRLNVIARYVSRVSRADRGNAIFCKQNIQNL